MKNSILFKSFLLAAVFMLPQLACAYDFMVNGLCYNKNSGGTSVTVTYQNTSSPRYTNLAGDLVIPETVTYEGITYSVTSIGNSAFYGCSGLTGNLVIPNLVTSIGNSAFYGCSGLTGNLVIPNSVTSIGFNAFRDCSGLTGNLVIPNLVTSIGNSAFQGCSGFAGNLVISNSVTSIGNSAFYGCSGLTGNLVIPNSVTSIGFNAFRDCSGLTGNLVIPNLVTSIGYSAFQGCSGFAGNLVISNSVTSIGDNAFQGCSGLTGDLVIPNSITSIDTQAFYDCSGFNGTLTLPNSVTSIGNDAFRNCSGLTGDLVLPTSVTSIGNGAFYNCSGFNGTLTIPNSVTTIGGRVFYGCEGFIGNLAIPSSVTSIGYEAFLGFKGLSSVTIPNSVRTIGRSAFQGCSGLKRIYSLIDNPSSVTLDRYVFLHVNTNTCVLNVPAGTVDAYRVADQWKDFLHIISKDVIDGYNFTSETSITVTAHSAIPITFSLKNAADVQKIEFDLSTSTWLNATGTVYDYDESTSEPWVARPVNLLEVPLLEVADRITENLIAPDWLYLFGYTDLWEDANILNGSQGESGLHGQVVLLTGDEVVNPEGVTIMDCINQGEGNLFSINLIPLKSGEHSIDVSNIKITLVDGTEIVLDTFTINITAAPIPGDVNDDGVVDENDLPAGSSARMVANSGNLVDGHVNTITLIPVKIENNFAISSISLKVTLPERIELVDDINTFVTAGERGENFTFTATQENDGTITIVGTSTTPLAPGDGPVLNLRVKSAWQNTYMVPLTEMSVTNPEGIVKSLPDSETCLVMQGVRGDMNGDGRVDLSDALYIINLATGQAE